jgi:hypothetical protein
MGDGNFKLGQARKSSFHMTYSFLRKFLGSGFVPEIALTSCSVFPTHCLYGGRNRLQVAV